MTRPHEFFFTKIPKLFQIDIVSSKTQEQVRWIDLDLGGLDVDYPNIDHFFFQPIQLSPETSPSGDPDNQGRKSLSALPIEAIEDVDWTGGMIRIQDGDLIEIVDKTKLAQAVLLRRDILDAYVIDLQNRRVTRANDLLLEDDEALRLIAADTGARALFRRLSGGLYQGYSKNELQDWKYIEFLRGDLSAVRAGAGYCRRISRLPPGEIANLAEHLPYLHTTELISLLPNPLAADTLELMTPERQIQVFEELDERDALSILEEMAPDAATDLIGLLTTEEAHHYLDQLPKSSSERIIDLLRYPEDTVGGIMTNDVVAIPGSLTVDQARERLKTKSRKPDFIHFLYIVDNDEDRHIKGVVTLRSILFAKEWQRLEDIMNTYLEALDPLEPAKHAANRLIQTQLAALPVATSDGRLLGVVTVDTAFRLVAPLAWSTQVPRVFS